MNLMKNAKQISNSVTCGVELAWNMSLERAMLKLEPVAQSVLEIKVITLCYFLENYTSDNQYCCLTMNDTSLST